MRAKAKVFHTGRSQAVRLPAAYRFQTKEVFVERDLKTGNLILSPKPVSWSEIFAELDRVGIPSDFMSDRDRSLPQERDEL